MNDELIEARRLGRKRGDHIGSKVMFFAGDPLNREWWRTYDGQAYRLSNSATVEYQKRHRVAMFKSSYWWNWGVLMGVRGE